MAEENYVGGALVSVDPIVTFSKRSSDAPMGIASVCPQTFHDRTVLHLIGLSFTIERGDGYKDIARDFFEISQALPANRFIILTNSEFEAYLLSKCGVRAMPVSQAIFLSEYVYRPTDVPVKYDAIYNARLTPFKRHELARTIGNLALLYDLGPADERSMHDEIRALLPAAEFVNHALGEGEYRHLTREECVVELNQARVGLCLSAAEGVMRAAIEYLLCGVPVVSTRSIGGRDRYLMAPFSRIVDDDPEAVRAAVDAFVRMGIPKQAVRGHIMHMLTADRHNFLIAVNKLVAETFGIAEHFKSFAPFEVGLTAWRPDTEFRTL